MERAIAVYREIALELNTEYLGSRQVVLIEGDSKRSAEWFQGRTDGGVKVNFPKSCAGLTVGDYCVVTVNEANSQGLKGEAVAKTTIAAEEEEESKRESFSRRCY
jgi:tRNA-2-methylthio-N6-dimethylallyladenosine synthase